MKLTPAIMLFACASAAQGGISQSTVTPPGGFAQAACYMSNSPGIISGQDLVAAGSPADSEEAGFSGNSSASASAAATSGSVSNNASATMGLGFANLAAHNTCPNSTLFAAGMCNGGWKDTFTVNSPSLNGQSGYMVFQIRCRGTIDVTGFAGSAGLFTSGYKNNVELGTNAHFNRGPSDAISTDRQARSGPCRASVRPTAALSTAWSRWPCRSRSASPSRWASTPRAAPGNAAPPASAA